MGGLAVAEVQEGGGILGSRSGLGVVVEDPAARLGTYGGWGRGAPVLARFPLSMALTPSSVMAQAPYGPQLRAAVEAGDLLPREAVLLFLLVERHRGRQSPWAPYLSALPKEFFTPLHLSREELAELRGTPLAEATEATRAGLQRRWGDLQPLVRAVLASSYVSGPPPSFADFVHAHSSYWSRALQLPDGKGKSARLAVTTRLRLPWGQPALAPRVQVNPGRRAWSLASTFATTRFSRPPGGR